MLGFASMTCGVGRQAMRPLLNHGGSLEHGDNGAFRRSGLHLTKDSDISRPGCGVSEKSGIWDTARDAGLKINNPMNGNTPSDWVREGFFDSGKTTAHCFPIAISPTIHLGAEIVAEVKGNEKYFSEIGLIGRFRGFWPSFPDLHKRISSHWKPILDGNIQIFPGARGFFVMVFDSVVDRNRILIENK
ncbi:hypothetical protein SUGI_0983610 [Cryptomeria japonica]|nr:hypothetical protein SUGI_0983610 [Cryptomeria japonica]